VILYEERRLDQPSLWYVFREPMNDSELAAAHLSCAKGTIGGWEWVYGGTVAQNVDHVKMMVCRSQCGNQCAKMAVEDVGLRKYGERSDPVDLIDEPREVRLHQKLKDHTPNDTSIFHMGSVCFKHSDKKKSVEVV
jgi:hypothetical protein